MLPPWKGSLMNGTPGAQGEKNRTRKLADGTRKLADESSPAHRAGSYF
jgi:hypothetical protein